MDDAELNRFVGAVLGDLGGAAMVPMVRLGEALGLYRRLDAEGPLGCEELAAHCGVDPRYLREWLSANAAAGYLDYEPATRRFALPEARAMVLAREDSPVSLAPAFDLAAAWQQSHEQVLEGFRTGRGVAWGEFGGCMFCAVARFFRPGYQQNLVDAWLPALDGVVDKLRAGAAVADVGCGHGWSTVLMAQAFPQSRFTGFDFHPGSIAAARQHAQQHGVADRVQFEVATAKEIPPGRFDLVCCFDCLHDMGDPAGAARAIHAALKPGGSWMVVEPMAGDALQDNLNLIGRIYYAASTMICVPTSRAQEVGAALGAQAGEARLREAIMAGGFAQVRRAAETPFNMVLEATG